VAVVDWDMDRIGGFGVLRRLEERSLVVVGGLVGLAELMMREWYMTGACRFPRLHVLMVMIVEVEVVLVVIPPPQMSAVKLTLAMMSSLLFQALS
jgi:hypothetical protein